MAREMTNWSVPLKMSMVAVARLGRPAAPVARVGASQPSE